MRDARGGSRSRSTRLEGTLASLRGRQYGNRRQRPRLIPPTYCYHFRPGYLQMSPAGPAVIALAMRCVSLLIGTNNVVKQRCC